MAAVGIFKQLLYQPLCQDSLPTTHIAKSTRNGHKRTRYDNDTAPFKIFVLVRNTMDYIISSALISGPRLWTRLLPLNPFQP